MIVIEFGFLNLILLINFLQFFEIISIKTTIDIKLVNPPLN